MKKIRKHLKSFLRISKHSEKSGTKFVSGLHKRPYQVGFPQDFFPGFFFQDFFQEFAGIFIFWNFLKFSWNFPGIFWNFSRTSWSFLEFPGIFRSFLEFSGIFRNIFPGFSLFFFLVRNDVWHCLFTFSCLFIFSCICL